MRKNILVPRDSAPFGHTKNRDLWKSAIHGLPVTLRIRVKSDNLIGWEYETIALGMLRKSDFPRGRDSWCWPKESRPLGTRMEQKDKPLINAGWPSHFTRGIQFFMLTKTIAAQRNEIVVSDKTNYTSRLLPYQEPFNFGSYLPRLHNLNSTYDWPNLYMAELSIRDE